MDNPSLEVEANSSLVPSQAPGYEASCSSACYIAGGSWLQIRKIMAMNDKPTYYKPVALINVSYKYLDLECQCCGRLLANLPGSETSNIYEKHPVP